MTLLLVLPILSAPLTGFVFLDHNGNGTRDRGEPGIPNTVVSDQVDVVVTDARGQFTINDSHGFGVVFVSVPTGYRSVGPFWRTAGPDSIAFGLTKSQPARDFAFVHASDTHISSASLPRTERLRSLVDSVRPAFTIITGDLVRDALRVPEAEATGYYELFNQEAQKFRRPLWTVPGNHEVFGIERDKSRVSADHPLYGMAMYRKYRGPDYYSFNYGGIHFVGLSTADIDDTRYYGHVNATQLEWLKKDLASIPPTMPVVTFNHIPFFTAVETINGLMDSPPAPSVITVGGKAQFRHSVSNAKDVIALIGLTRFPLALGGHMHVREQLRYAGIPTRFFQTAAVVGPSESGPLTMPSGVTVYRVRAGKIDDGTFVPM